MEIRFDDLDGLRSQISVDYGDWGPAVEVSQAMIDRFADLTGDHQWIHVDIEKARKGPFGTPIAHGFLTIALMPAYFPSFGFDIAGAATIINYGSESYRFLAPVPAGRRVHARGRVVDAREHRLGTLLIRELDVAVVDSPKSSLVYTAMHLLQG
jgi:hypothetical protein